MQINGFPSNDIRVAIDVINAAQLGCKKLALRTHCKRTSIAPRRKGSFGSAPSGSPLPTRNLWTRFSQIAQLYRVASSSVSTNGPSLDGENRDHNHGPNGDDDDDEWQWWHEGTDSPQSDSEDRGARTGGEDGGGDGTSHGPEVARAQPTRPDRNMRGRPQRSEGESQSGDREWLQTSATSRLHA